MFLIVGAGLAGDSAAATLRAEGYDGEIVLAGDENQRPYDRPPLSKDALTGEFTDDKFNLRAPDWYEESRIGLRLGSAALAIHPASHSVTFADGATLAYEKLLLATGTRARTLPSPATARVPNLVVRTLDDAKRLRRLLQPGKHLVVIGAGVIGLETAASAVALGCTVDVVDLADRVMPRVLPLPLSDYIAALHSTNGVRLHLAAGAVTLTDTGISTLNCGDFTADLIVVGIGVVPNTELAAAAGLTCRDGIIVDKFCQTSDPDIFAVGDAVRYPDPFGTAEIRSENWKHAQHQASVAARNMLGQRVPYVTVSSMWSDQFDVKLQAVGTLSGAQELVRGEAGSKKFMHIYLDAAKIIVGALGVNSAKDMRFVETLIQNRTAVDPERLTDPKQDLRKLALQAAA